MIKIRLHGEEPEIERMAELVKGLESTGQVRLLNESADYADRPPSVYKRRYLDVDVVSVRSKQ